MKLGILSDTHDELNRTKRAVEILCIAGVEALVHCGDLTSPPILRACSVLPCWFAFGNHDADVVPSLQSAAEECGAVSLGWGGVFELVGTKIGVAHGHLTLDVRNVLRKEPDFLLTGHLHFPRDSMDGNVRRINPGAIHRADAFTVAVLDLATGELLFLPVS